MILRRVLKLVNWLILALLVAAAGMVYWFAWRPLPKTSGTLSAPVSARATVQRDARGIPHITAAKIEDALFLQGFCAAQDRMWQMDAMRRAAAGRLAEVISPSLVQVDRSARRLRMERLAEEHAAALTPADRALMAAYARGVNHYLETNRGRLSFEFNLLGYDPLPWRIADSVLIGLYMYRDLTTTWTDELEKAEFLGSGDRAKVLQLYALGPSGVVVPGSNAWVVAGSRTASGKPLLSNDPHLEYSMPGLWYPVHLRAPGLDVTGVSLPGAPAVIIGHNDRIAWGVTNLGYDVQDLYIEKLDPRTGRYLFAGKEEQARLEQEVIRVKGGAAVEYAQWVTRHGPVATENGRHLALRWTAAEPGSYQFPFLDLNRARNWQEFTTALARYPGPGQNFVYADVDGNIGYQATGRLPVRRKYAGDVPIDGASGEYEWEGFIPFEQLPRAFNPPSGMIATANQNPFPPEFPYPVNGQFASPYRAHQIGDILASRKHWRAAEMVTVQKDVYSVFSHRLAKAIVQAHARRGGAGEGIAEAIRLIREWNGQMEKGTAAPLIATLAYQHLRKAVADRAAPGKGVEYGAAPVPNRSNQVAPAVIDAMLTARPSDWFQDWDQVLVKALQDGVEEGRRMQGRAIERWNWGLYNRLLLAHPVGSQIPLIGKYFNIGPVEQSGSSLTVKQTTRRLGPSMRMTSDLGDWDRSILTLVTGVSGHPLSGHYKDNWEAYWSGVNLPFPYRKLEIKDTLTFEPAPPK